MKIINADIKIISKQTVMKLNTSPCKEKSVTLLPVSIDIGGRPILLHQNGKLEDTPSYSSNRHSFLAPYPGASPPRGTISSNRYPRKESIQSLKRTLLSENRESRRALKITVYVKKETELNRDTTTIGQITP